MVQSFRKNIKGAIGAFLIVIIASSVALQVQRQATLAAPIETKITASDGVSGDYFSWSVFIDGNYAIVGAPFDDDNGNDSGSAYIFKKTGGVWSQIKKLTASDGAAGDHFGQSVSIAGNYAIVGAPWDNSELGSAYMFKQDQGGADQWGQIKKLTASDGAAGDHFSESVAIDGDYAIVGAIYNTHSGFWKPGAAYIFKQGQGGADNWGQIKKLIPSELNHQVGFGRSVSISGNYAIVGADGNNSNTGAAYIFKQDQGGADNWGEIKKLLASDGAVDDYFGCSVSISDNYAIVGAYGDGGNFGAAYMFKQDQGGPDNWGEIKKLTASDGAANDYFGLSVSISGDYAIVGAYSDDDNGSMSGSAYMFKQDEGGADQWGQTEKLTASDGAANAYFGSSVSISGGFAISGAYGGGAAYIYRGYNMTDVTADFTDANFANCVETALGTPGIIYAEDAAALTTLDCSNKGISSIAGAEYLTGITWDFLWLDKNNISDLTPLSGLTGLRRLFIGQNNISDISALAGLTNLTFLDFYDNNISNISALSGMTDLYQLGMGLNNISDISALSGKSDMVWLSMFSNNISDIGVLSDMTNLWRLEAYDNNISDLSPLSGLSALRLLHLESNNISDISALSGLDLTQLLLGINNISNISALSGMTNMTSLELSSNNISDLSPIGSGNGNLAGFASGNNIDISNNPLHDQADLDEVALLEANGATVTHNISLTCGNGILNPGEQCDDGNTIGGDGCSSNCYFEFPRNYNETKTWALDGAASDYFGWSASISGDYAIVGAFGDDSYKGSAYILFKTAEGKWIQLKKLTASDGVAWDRFGYSVSISGDYAVVGAWVKNSQTGAAYIFYKNQGGADNWGEQKKITASDASPFADFGYSVDIDGNYVIVGAYAAGSGGKAYLYYKDQAGINNWGEQDIITGSDTINGDDFGTSVAISGDYAVLGSPGNDPPGFSVSGAAYIFQRSGSSWTQQGKLTANVKADLAYFGHSVDIEGDYAVVGADNSGFAYVFKKPAGVWTDMTETARLTTGSQMLGARHLISISGNHVAVGVSLYNGNYTGAVYLFTKPAGEEWSDTAESLKITASDADTNDYLGLSVSISGDYIISGTMDDDNGTDSGAAYIYVTPPNAPSDFSAIDYTGATATLRWTDNSTDEDNFNIYYSTTNSQPGSPSYTPIADAVSQPVAGLSNTTPNFFWLTSERTDPVKLGESLPVTTCVRTLTPPKLLACDGAAGYEFGRDVSLSGDYAMVSAGNGSVYFFKKNGSTWVQIKKVTGSSVAIDGNYAATGAWNSESVNIYYKDQGGADNWGKIKTLHARDGLPGDYFGLNISMSGDHLIVGALYDDDPVVGNYTGAAYIFYKDQGGVNNWGEVAKITGDLQSGAYFGNSVEINGNYAIVGASNEDSPGTDQGAAYIFYKDQGGIDKWGRVKKLSASDGAAADQFGSFVSILDDHAIVSSSYVGKVYIYEKDLGGADNWGERKKLTGTVNSFGYDVHLYDNLALIGDSNTGARGNTGSVYVYEKDRGGADNWGLRRIVTDPNAVGGEILGRSISASNDYFIAGAYQDPEDGSNAGSAYLFSLLCGNGVINAPEECDGGGESATCDSDCTFAMCGDGMINATAGEECDDSNTADGDGCDSNCKHEGDLGCKWTFDQIVGFPIDDTFCATVCSTNFGYPSGYAPDALHCFCFDQTKVQCDAICATLTGFGFTNPVCEFIQPAPAGGGGSRAPEPPLCTATLTKIDLPATLPVSQIGGKPTVVLNWSKINTQEINAEQKIGILFDYFNQPIKPVIGASKKRVENVFAKYIYGEVIKDAELASSLKNKIGETNYKNLIGCDCNNDLASTVTNAVKALRSQNEIKDRLNAIIVDFANDLLAIEAVITQADSEAGTPFTDFYNTYFPSGVYEGMTVEIYRGGNLIYTETNPNNTSYSDDGLPINNSGSVKYYNYYIVTTNRCGDSLQGASGQAKIDPQIPSGTNVDVSLDISIKVKDAYSVLFMDKLKEILLQNETANTTTGYNEGEPNMCEEMRQAFLVEKKDDKMFAYILECFAGYDFRLRTKLEEIESNIVPPLLKMLQLSEGKMSRETIVEQFMYPLISKINLEFSLVNAAKENLGNLNLNIAEITGKQMSDLTESEMNEIRKIGETVFEGASHSADLIIEKYDSDNKLLGSYIAHTDVFGIVKGVSIGQMTSGKDYTLKIRLKDVKYVLPHTVTLNVRNALLLGDKYKTSITLNFPKHFRYGDFNQDDQINLQDIVEWGKILGEKPEEWDNANLDGLQGINILDVLTLQENWGKLEGTKFGQSQMSLGDLLNALGISIMQPSGISMQAEVIIPGWLSVIRSVCP